MDASDSLYLDENLARLLAAFDQGIGEADGKAATVAMEPYVGDSPSGLGDREDPGTDNAARPLNEGSAGELFPVPTPTPAPSFLGVAGPHRIGRFELRRQLGKGGCGIVFLAYDPKLKREVALKLPRPEMLLSDDARRRLLREAHAAAEFDHPNLVPVYETGEIGPLCFIATAFCPGQTLAEWLDRQSFPVPVRQAARLMAQIADAIQHAHDRGVLHRDMKPNNVILQQSKADPNDVGPPPGSCLLCGAHYIPRVVDFGLAKLSERGPTEPTTRQILGTPKYMAPEQAQAQHDDVGPQADVYALGVMLYELITGRAPYDGATDVEVLRLAVEGNLVPPRSIREDIPRDLEAICLKAMARTPVRRYRTAIDLADDLRRFLDDLPTLARPLNRLGRSARWLRRNDQVVALGVVTAIAILFLTIGLWTMYQSELLRTDRDNIRAAQDGRARLDRQREYARYVRDAFLAWRAGDRRQMADFLDMASMLAAMNDEPTCFAWGYLSHLAKADRVFVASPWGPAVSLAASPSGDRFSTGHADGTIAIWNARTGDVIASVQVHSPVKHLAFLNGGADLVTATDEPALRSYSLTADGTLRPGESILQLGSPVASLMPDTGRRVHICTQQGELLTWDNSGPEVLASRRQSSGRITASAIAPDGSTMAWVDERSIIRLAAGEAESMDAISTESRILSVALIPGKKTWGVAAVDVQGHVRVHRTGGREDGRLDTGNLVPVSLAASPDGTGLALGTLDGTIAILDTASGSLRNRLRGHRGPVRQLCYGSDGKCLFTAADDGTIQKWNLDSDSEAEGVRVFSRPLSAVAAAHNGQTYVAAFADGSVESQSRMGGPRRQIRPPGGVAIRLLHVGERPTPIGVELAGSQARVWGLDRPPRAILSIPTATGREAATVDLSKDGTALALGDQTGQVVVWSVAERRKLNSFETGMPGPVRRVSISSDGRWIAAPSSSETYGVWEAGKPDRTANATIEEIDSRLTKVLPGGDRLLSPGGSSIKAWSLPAGTEELNFLGHVAPVTVVAVSPDGRTLASGDAFGEVKLWDLRTGEELLGLRRHDGPVRFAEFSGSGNVLITGTSSTRAELAIWETARE